MKKKLEKFRSWEACCGCFRDGGANGTRNAGGLQEWKRLFSDSQEGNETRPYNPKELNLANNQNAPGSRFISREEYRPIDALILAFYETLSRGFVWATLHHNFSTPEMWKNKWVFDATWFMVMFYNSTGEFIHVFNLEIWYVLYPYSPSQFGWPPFKFSIVSMVIAIILDSTGLGQEKSRCLGSARVVG